jgi:uncharacterized protein (DUF488 family)
MVFTIGHSTRAFDEFVDLLCIHRVKGLLDIRTVPRSRHNPQYNREILPEALEQKGIGYFHMPGLGGLRHARKDSTNLGWRNLSFRGYADHMGTPEFQENLEKLIELSQKENIALMCAESVPWRCHRSLVADALVIRGIPVAHILNASPPKAHTLTPFAVVEGNRITYPGTGEDS